MTNQLPTLYHIVFFSLMLPAAKSLLYLGMFYLIHFQNSVLPGYAELGLDALDVTKDRVHDIAEKIPAIHHD